MRVVTRLYLAVLPAVLGVLLVAALAYWGRYARAVPESVVIVAAVAAVSSLALAWSNTRYVAQRVERLAQGPGRGERPRATVRDELDTIEHVVDTLNSEVTVARVTGAERERFASARVAEYAALLAETSAAVARRLEEARLPLHILLENRFGELNENQEEMLGAARAATDEADLELRRLREIAVLDQGALALRVDSIKPGQLLTSLLPTIRAKAQHDGVSVEASVAPGLPRIIGDQTRLREALLLCLSRRVAHTAPGEVVRIRAEREREVVFVRVTHGPTPLAGAEELLARRLVEAHEGRIETSGTRTEIVLPVARSDGSAAMRREIFVKS